jgi:hypothetical protein
MDYQEFRLNIIKSQENRKHKVTNSYGTKQAWRWIKKNKWLDIGQPITEREFGLIIKAIHKTLVDQLLSCRDIDFPHRMGKIELRKFNTWIGFKNGKLLTNLPIDWNKTIELWYEDRDAYDRKTFVRREAKEGYKIRYEKGMATYNNKTFYEFLPNKELKRKLKDKIENGEIDAFLLQKHDIHKY